MTPILMKKKSHSAPESDTSSCIYDATPVPKKKLSLDGTLTKSDSCGSTKKELTKENLQEKDLDEASEGRSSVSKTSPAATLTSVNDNLTSKL